jgi:hypothetical protein
MRRSRIKVVLVTVAMIALIYVGSFLALKFGVIGPYEGRRTFNQHWMRPTYNVLYYPLRWLYANGWSPIPHPSEILRGSIDSISQDNVTLHMPDSSFLSIGFTASSEVLESTRRFSPGDTVEVGLGTTLFKDSDAFRNRLLYIRKVQR